MHHTNSINHLILNSNTLTQTTQIQKISINSNTITLWIKVTFPNTRREREWERKTRCSRLVAEIQRGGSRYPSTMDPAANEGGSKQRGAEEGDSVVPWRREIKLHVANGFVPVPAPAHTHSLSIWLVMVFCNVGIPRFGFLAVNKN